MEKEVVGHIGQPKRGKEVVDRQAGMPFSNGRLIINTMKLYNKKHGVTNLGIYEMSATKIVTKEVNPEYDRSNILHKEPKTKRLAGIRRRINIGRNHETNTKLTFKVKNSEKIRNTR